MIAFDAWQLPDGETHLQTWMTGRNHRVDGRLTYQFHKYEAARAFCLERRVAIDVGAHVGLWSYWMARDFAALYAFEPLPTHQACWRANLAEVRNSSLFAYALGDHSGPVALETGPGSSGDTFVSGKGVRAGMRRLDEWPWTSVDLLKIDCEGYEYFVLLGGLETVRRCRPVIIVEQKPGHGAKFGIDDRAGIELLKHEGYILRGTLSGDAILTPKERP